MKDTAPQWDLHTFPGLVHPTECSERALLQNALKPIANSFLSKFMLVIANALFNDIERRNKRVPSNAALNSLLNCFKELSKRFVDSSENRIPNTFSRPIGQTTINALLKIQPLLNLTLPAPTSGIWTKCLQEAITTSPSPVPTSPPPASPVAHSTDLVQRWRTAFPPNTTWDVLKNDVLLRFMNNKRLPTKTRDVLETLMSTPNTFKRPSESLGQLLPETQELLSEYLNFHTGNYNVVASAPVVSVAGPKVAPSKLLPFLNWNVSIASSPQTKLASFEAEGRSQCVTVSEEDVYTCSGPAGVFEAELKKDNEFTSFRFRHGTPATQEAAFNTEWTNSAGSWRLKQTEDGEVVLNAIGSGEARRRHDQPFGADGGGLWNQLLKSSVIKVVGTDNLTMQMTATRPTSNVSWVRQLAMKTVESYELKEKLLNQEGNFALFNSVTHSAIDVLVAFANSLCPAKELVCVHVCVCFV